LNPSEPLRRDPKFIEGSGPCWKLIEERCGALSRIQQEVTKQLTDVHAALATGISEVLLEEMLALYPNPTIHLRGEISEELARSATSAELAKVFKKHMGDWPVEQYFDGLSPFDCLRTIELTKASIETVGLEARIKPEARTLFDFLAVEMFGRFDVALTDEGLDARKSFFAKESPEALLQQQRLQCVLSFLVRVGFMAEQDRAWIRSLAPAVFEGEVCRAFCQFLRDRGGVPIQGAADLGQALDEMI
jgi:hypothetical protein